MTKDLGIKEFGQIRDLIEYTNSLSWKPRKETLERYVRLSKHSIRFHKDLLKRSEEKLKKMEEKEKGFYKKL